MGIRLAPELPRRNAPFEQEPGFYPDAGLWMYGNVRLLGAALSSIPLAFGRPFQTPSELDMIECETEQSVLGGKVVTGIHSPAHQRVAIAPLR